MVTQNLFESAPYSYPTAYPTVRSQLAQGEGDADPIDVVLTRSTARPAAMTVSSSMAGATAGSRPVAKSVGREERNWWVQVGAFRNHRDAKAQVEEVSRRFGQVFDDAEGLDGGFHRRGGNRRGQVERRVVSPTGQCSTSST